MPAHPIVPVRMPAHFGPQPVGDVGGERGHLATVDASGPFDLHRELGGDAAGPAAQQHDAIGQAGRFAHVVRDEDDREARRQEDAFKLVVQKVAGHGVERAERLVHEEHVGILGEGAGHRYALAHAAGELVWALVGEPAEVHTLEQIERLRPAITARHTPQPQRQLDVARDGEPREQRRLLEHDGAPQAVAENDLAGGRPVEPGDEVEQGRLPAARGADQTHELAGGDREVEPIERQHRARPVAEPLRRRVDAHGDRWPGEDIGLGPAEIGEHGHGVRTSGFGGRGGLERGRGAGPIADLTGQLCRQ